jgi:hypothetical protein
VTARIPDKRNRGGTLDGGQSDDTFHVTGGLTGTWQSSGDPSASDVLNFTSTGGNVTVNFATSTIQETGFAAVSFTGVEVLNTNVGNADIFVLGTVNDDEFTVTPDVAVATTRLQFKNLTLNANNIDEFFINGVSGDDTLTVNATATANTVNVTGTFVDITVPDRQRIDYLNFDDLRVIGFSGNDTFTVTPSATTIFIDGAVDRHHGDDHPEPPGLHEGMGPEIDEGLVSAGLERVSWDHIEGVIVVPPGQDSCAIVLAQRRRRHHHHCRGCHHARTGRRRAGLHRLHQRWSRRTLSERGHAVRGCPGGGRRHRPADADRQRHLECGRVHRGGPAGFTHR